MQRVEYRIFLLNFNIVNLYKQRFYKFVEKEVYPAVSQTSHCTILHRFLGEVTHEIILFCCFPIMSTVLTIVGVAVLLFAVALRIIPRAAIPDHLANHKTFYVDDLIDPETRLELVASIRAMKTFGSNVDTTKATGFVPAYEHTGEAVPVNSDGSCTHTFLIPNAKRTICILPERIDVGKHFIMSGGVDGMKESYADLLDRVSSFARYTFNKDIDNYPVVKRLFESTKFKSAAMSVCPKEKKFLDPFQFTFILTVPGQTVAAHLDAPYFWGANRFRFPQWLLVSMVFSNLFNERFVDQIQVVSYLHEQLLEGGDFVYYTNSSHIGTVIAKPGAGVIVDGSKVMHAAKVYRPDVKAPHLPKDKSSELVYSGNDFWEIYTGGVPAGGAKYATTDLRISMVYRARCFSTPEEAHKYSNMAEEDMLTLDHILSTFKRDLLARKATTHAKLVSMGPMELANLIIDTYAKYPLPPVERAWIPFNYCALPRIFPWTTELLRLFC